MSTIQSIDGTTIGYTVTGKGPGLLIIHGTFRASEHYQKLAKALSDKFTVYVMDRRGRNHSGAKGADYSIQKECEDAIAIMKAHEITYLFGHSFGAVASLYISMQYPLAKLALYEAPLLSVMDVSWMPKFEELLKKEDMVSASVVFIKGMKMGGVMRVIPNFILRVLFNKMAHGEEWEQNCKLLKNVPQEFQVIAKEGGTFEAFKNINTETLILGGTKTTHYLKVALIELANTLKNSKTVMLEGLDHNGPDEGNPEVVAVELAKFFV
ncbi:MAG: alpha/beta hydrolase [Herbinix sp.]|jgi:pimeloyl-ACP methyl ester carboxylesterase|nr:alpha/beta hydrolase [Herbinix sp.]